MATPYKLRCNLAGHQSDVRALVSSIVPENGIISASRDNTSCIWVEDEGANSYVKDSTLRGHTNFVSSVCVMPPDDTHPQGLIVTGSNDKSILAYMPGVPDPVFKLEGHTGNVCALASGKFGFLLSGSWDKTARVWLNQKCVMVLEGHELAVWAVAIISGQGVMLTGSADKTIKSWKAGKCMQTYKGHEDCVRALGVISEAEFLSCSNDATVRRWAVNSGECLNVFYGHTNYVYSLSILPNGTDFVTGSEDRTLRVWKGGKLTQTLYHPCESVWAVWALGNGDIATGASDGMVRVFTCEPSRYGNAEVLAAHEASLASAPVAAQPLGDIKTEDLPGPDSLQTPGKKDGQTTMINTGGSVDCYQWDASQNKWIKIGNVVGSSGGSQKTSGKTLYEGKEYDWVFSVDIQEGAPPLKLPFNATDDPWVAAQAFIHKNELSQAFLDQVANFIVENTKGVTLGGGLPFTDPFTGGDRYVPGKEDATGSTMAGSLDPFTGGSRYVPEGQEAAKSSATNGHFPIQTCLFFDSVSPIEQIVGKLKQFNKSSDEDKMVNESDLDDLASLLTGTPKGNSVLTLDKLLSWPSETVFPALDILRMTIKDPALCKLYCGKPEFLSLLCRHSAPGNPAPCRMLALRTLANIFRQSEGVALALNQAGPVSEAAQACRDLPKNGQTAGATVLMNMSVSVASLDNLEAKASLMTAATVALGAPLDPEAAYRLMVGLGTLLARDEACLALAHSLSLPTSLAHLAASDVGKLAECSRLVMGVLGR